MVQVLLLLASYFDVKENRIPNYLNAAGLAAGLLVSAVRPDRKLSEAVLGAAISFLIGFFCWILRAIRSGDAKLLCAVGALLGWKMSLNCFAYSLLVAGAIGLPMVIGKYLIKKTGQTEVPFALMLTFGTFLGKKFGFLWDLPFGLF